MEFMGRAPSVTACVAVLAFFGVVLGGQRQFVRIRFGFCSDACRFGSGVFFFVCAYLQATKVTHRIVHTPVRGCSVRGVPGLQLCSSWCWHF